MCEKVIVKYIPNTGELNATGNNSNAQTITKLINLWNKTKYSGLSGKDFMVCFVLHDEADYLHGTNVKNENDRQNYSFAQDVLKHQEGGINIPIVHIAKENILIADNVYRYKKIVDSSIWNHIIIIEKGKTINRLNEVIKQIGDYSDEGRYSLGLAHEYCDLHARLVEQSHLYDGSPHNDISPFLFHSEKEMHDKIEEYKKRMKDYYEKEKKYSPDDIQAYKWRFLLLDDKSVEPMTGVSYSTVDITKLQILANNLQRILGFDDDKIWFRSSLKEKEDKGVFKLVPDNYGNVKDGVTANNWPNESEDVQVVIDCAPSIRDAKLCMNYCEYEIVLLDYLLEGEYGYELLKELHDWNKGRSKTENRNDEELKNRYQIGPYNRSFFMFISSFTTAVHERLLEQGFNRSEPGLWFIGDGACPTNTPYLFSYQLLLRMQHRLNDLRGEHEGGFNTIIDLLKSIFVESGSAFKDVRRGAHDHFNDVLYMRNKYRQLEKDLKRDEEKELNGNHKNDGQYVMNMESSLLVHSIFRVVHLFSGAFFEHLQHLIYLTAFGTIRQWEELWEEYVFVHNELEDYDRLMSDQGEQVECKDGQHISNAIRDYIIKLKENAY